MELTSGVPVRLLREKRENGSMMDEWKREKSVSKVNSKFLSDSFNCVLEGIFILSPLETIFYVKRIQTNSNLG
jgi:hypothetical protein